MILLYGGETINTEKEDPAEKIQELMDTDKTLYESAVCIYHEISSRECTITICRKFHKDMVPEPGYMTGRDGYILMGVSLRNYWPQFLWKPCGENEEENLSSQYFIPIELFAFCYKKACEELGADVPEIVFVSTKKNMVVMKLVY